MYTKASIGFTGAKSIVNAMAPETSSLKKSLRKSFTGWFGGNEPESEAEVENKPEKEVDEIQQYQKKMDTYFKEFYREVLRP